MTFPFRRILTGISQTEADGALLGHAAMLADISPLSEFRFVHVFGPPMSHDRALSAVQQTVSARFPEAGSDRYQCHAVHGIRIDKLLEYSVEESCDLILIGHHQRHGGRRSLARRLAMKAPCSLWMVPNGTPASLNRILTAIDFSAPSALALQVAASIARARGLPECLALHVYFDFAVATYEEYQKIIKGKERAAFSTFVSPLDLSGIRVEPRFEEGTDVSEVITRVAGASGADLVVMGTRGRSESAAVLLGSESEQMIMESRMPVLIVKQFGERIGVLRALFDRDFRHEPAPRFG